MIKRNFLEFFIAWRYLVHRTGESFISLISVFSFVGITLGVATLVIVMSVMNGFHEKLINNIIGIGGHINVSSVENEISEHQKIVSSIKKHSGITKIIPMIQGQSLVSVENNNSGVLIFGIENLEDKKSLLKNLKINSKFNEEKRILIGIRLAESMNLKVGDYLQMISSKSVSSMIGEIPRMKNFEIGGIFESGIYDFDFSTIFMPLKQAQLFFQLYDSVNKLEIYLSSSDISSDVSRNLTEELGGSTGLIFNDWRRTNSHYLGALESEKSVMFLILSLIILIAMFNVISSLVMMVTEKQKSIAILRSFGMSEIAITRIFIYCGMSISIGSTTLGSILGIIFSLNINQIKRFIENFFDITLFDKSVYIFNEMPVLINYYDVLYVTLFSIILSLLAVIYPSRKAAKLDPATILRHL